MLRSSAMRGGENCRDDGVQCRECLSLGACGPWRERTRLQSHLCACARNLSLHTPQPHGALATDTLLDQHDCSWGPMTDVTPSMACGLGRLGCRSLTEASCRRNHTPLDIERNCNCWNYYRASEVPTDRLKRPPPAAVSGTRLKRDRHVHGALLLVQLNTIDSASQHHGPHPVASFGRSGRRLATLWFA
jgi:hypothetical protein